MKIAEEVEGTPEQRAALSELRNKMLAFMGANKIYGTFVAVDTTNKFTTAALNVSGPESIFTQAIGSPLALDPKIEHLLEVIRRQPELIYTAQGMEQYVSMAVRSAMTLHILSEMRKAAVDQLDNLLDAERLMKGLIDAYPDFIKATILEALPK